MNKEKCLVFPACLVRYMCLAFCVWIIQSKPPWMYIYRAGSQRKYIRTLLITSFDPQFPRPKLLPTNRYHKKIRSPLGWNSRHAALNQKRENLAGQGGFLFSKVDHWGFFSEVSHCTNVVYLFLRTTMTRVKRKTTDPLAPQAPQMQLSQPRKGKSGFHLFSPLKVTANEYQNSPASSAS